MVVHQRVDGANERVADEGELVQPTMEAVQVVQLAHVCAATTHAGDARQGGGTRASAGARAGAHAPAIRLLSKQRLMSAGAALCSLVDSSTASEFRPQFAKLTVRSCARGHAKPRNMVSKDGTRRAQRLSTQQNANHTEEKRSASPVQPLGSLS